MSETSDSEAGLPDKERRAFWLGVYTSAFAAAVGGILGLIVVAVLNV